jgi:phage gpG-like protein
MTDGVLVNIEQLKMLQQSLGQFTSRFANMTPAMAEVAITMKSQVGRTFNRQADPVSGAPWKALGKLTLGNRRGSGQGAKPLRDTGRLLQSLIASNPVVSANAASISTNLVYANVQNYGGTIRPTRSKYLAIPLDAEAAKAGGARRYFDRLKTNPNLQMSVRFPVMGVVNVRTGKFTPKFLLKSSVTIPGRRYLGFGNEYAEEIMDIVADYAFEDVVRQIAMLIPPVGGAR